MLFAIGNYFQFGFFHLNYRKNFSLPYKKSWNAITMWYFYLVSSFS